MGVLGTTNTNTPDKTRGLSAAGNGSTPPPAGPPGPGGAAGPGGGGAGRPNGPAAGGLAITGGAAIVAPVRAFPGGIPTNPLIVLPLAAPRHELKAQLEKGPVALTPGQRR